MKAATKPAVPFTPSPLLAGSPFARIQDVRQLGQMLRDLRLSRHLTVEKIAGDLRLKPAALAAVEDGEWEQLPGTAYARGYVRQYAEYLGLSGEQAALCCQQLQGNISPDLRFLSIAASRETPSPNTLWASALLLLLVFFGWSMISSVESVRRNLPELATLPAVITTASLPKMMPVLHRNVAATCLNIPQTAIWPCYPLENTVNAPSLLLTGLAAYPIWKATWQNTSPTR